MSTSSSSTSLPAGLTESELWDVDYINPEHVQAFERALAMSDAAPPEGDMSPYSPRSPPISIYEGISGNNQPWKNGPDNGSTLGSELNGHGRGERVEKLTATSDFAPIHQRVSRRRTQALQQGLTYHLLRWPILAFLFGIIYFEFGLYVLIRQIVNAFEYLVAWRGYKSSLRQEMRKAKTYEEWVQAAKKLDTYLGFDDWKEVEEDSYFDHVLVKRVRRTLTKLRNAKDTRGLMDALAVCIRSNFAGTESVKMYSETFYGTKKIVESHVREVAACLDFVRTATDVSLEEKRAFFRAINKNYGSSALCLSGGASFGYYHFGVIKAFLDADLLPRVVTGTSAGGLVAALLCTRTNDELKQLLVPRLADKITACSDPFRVWFKRFRKTGARFSSVEWAEKAMFFTRGSLTFKEAYERTGRALNVSVVPSDRHSPTILLNHLTAPNCLIWSAILASAAVPGILNPVVLMAKDRNGQVKPHNLGGSRFKDGSLREDIPLGSLHTQFNCNFSIVSQTNPHIHLFFFAPRGSVGRPVAHRKGKGWRGGFILSALESYIKLDLTKHFKVIRDLDLLPQLLQSDWSGVFLQRFSGDLTLTPRSTFADWFKILSDPNRERLERMLDVGQRVTWPALRMVHNRMAIERAILRGRTEVRHALQRDRTTIDTDVRDTDRPIDGLPAISHVPIESDADAGFALRSRKSKTTRARAGGTEAYAQSNTVRNRMLAERHSQPAPDTQQVDREADRGYTTSLSDRLRHVRSSSLTAFASPFRRYSQSQHLSAQNEQRESEPRRRSQLSISRWFGGVSESSSEEEDDDGTGSPGGGGDETPRFSQTAMGLDESALVDDPDSTPEGDVEPIPGGESVDQQTIDAGAAAGERFLPVSAGGGRGAQYSPPQQDEF